MVIAFSAMRKGSRTPESRSPCAAWKPAAQPHRRGSSRSGRGNCCAGPGVRGSSRRRRPRSGLRLPAPSDGAAKPIISHNRSASGVFSTSVRRFIGHRWFLGCVGVSQPDPTRGLPETTAKPPARYGAIGARVRAALLYRPTPPRGTRSCAARSERSTRSRICNQRRHQGRSEKPLEAFFYA